VFRLSRIDGDVTEVRKAQPYAVPADHRAQEMVRSSVGEQPNRDAVVRVRADRGNTLRRRATSTTELGDWSELVVPFGDDDALADEVCGYGPDVVVVSPPEVRDLVVQRLRGALAAHSGGAA